MIDYEAAKRINRLRWLWERAQFYRQHTEHTPTRLKRIAAMDMEIDRHYRGDLGEHITPAR